MRSKNIYSTAGWVVNIKSDDDFLHISNENLMLTKNGSHLVYIDIPASPSCSPHLLMDGTWHGCMRAHSSRMLSFPRLCMFGCLYMWWSSVYDMHVSISTDTHFSSTHALNELDL